MGLTRSQADAELRKLYDRIPAIPDCDGRCWTSCGPLDMSDRERQRIRQAGHRITPWREAQAWRETYYCEALTAESFAQRRAALEATWDELLARPVTLAGDRYFLGRMRNTGSHHFGCLYHDVETTNNRAERAIRPDV